MPELICPKCQSPMRSYERNGVTIDQCSGCRGVFLDRGELERLVDAESAYYERPQPQREERFEHREGRDRDDDERRGGYGPGFGHGHGHGKRRKKSFLDDFLDFG